MKKITLQEEDVDYIVDLINKNKSELSDERYEELIQRLIKSKNDIITRKNRTNLSEHSREMGRIYSRIKYYLTKRKRVENDDIKLQMYVDKFNKLSYLKQVKIVDGKIVSEYRK